MRADRPHGKAVHMLFRKRERFERTDVPVPGPYTNVIGGVVLALVAALVFIVVSRVSARVAKECRLGDTTLSKQVSSQSAMTVTDASYSISQDTFTKVLFLTVSDVSDLKKGTSLASAQVLLIHEIDRDADDEHPEAWVETRASLATIPLEAKVTSGDTSATLANFCASKGAAACVVPLNAAANIKFTHVVVSTEDMFAQLKSFEGADSETLIDTHEALLKKLYTDMSAAELVTIANKASLVSDENLNRVDAPLVAETAQAEDGSTVETGYQVIDRTGLCTSVGTLV